MIAQAGLLAFRMGQTTPLGKSTITQRSVARPWIAAILTTADSALMPSMLPGELDARRYPRARKVRLDVNIVKVIE